MSRRDLPARSTEEFQQLVESTMAMLLRAAQDRKVVMTADMRVSETEAAGLLGYAPGSLKNKRQAGKGPVHYDRAVNGSRVSYRLMDLALWLESKRQVW
ncbi:hypothetical protein RCH10_003786 [Variovorax sp. GrIS 2.14]|uniref:hypothetical protein n=1 Tax=Variovorax sp. GrIS 2.14 TaxID=3071709 RepID=UPI0038F703DD